MYDKKQKKADIVAVAIAAGVSPATVSRFFNRPELVRLSTRRKIDRTVKKLGYIRNRAAQTIHGIRSGTIGLVVPTIDNTIFAEMIQAFSDEVGLNGFTILLGTHNYNNAREYDVLRKFLEHRVDGVAVVGLDHSEEVYNLIESQNIPSVSLWNYAKSSRLICVGADNFDAGRKIAAHVLAQGYSKITTLFPPLAGNDRATSRANGIMEVLEEGGVSPALADQLETLYSISSAKKVVIDYLKSGSRPDAIICCNDILALGAVYASQSLGLSVPEDIAVTGVGDFKGSKEIEPALTTIRIPAKTIGALGGAALVQSIISPESELENRCCVSDLVTRSTC
ncbi:MAG: substrate-binding domain-containing protein [Tateyamaria sp.]|nr:substrate-binding domain-containing protein [Tateyamaria sp.]MDG1420229.1 substrate-binding domain-containing protein [Tateyamaria sp.]MDG1679728.1 substrate-binding domain-containing protein [Tateyamaria sp.]MDG2379692.1 substrate-binding domain-containing protein [Tateyamaria sp.]